MASQAALVAKNPPVSTRVARHAGSIPGLGRSPGGGHGNPLQYSCLENPIDRGAWQATVHEVARVGHDLVTKEERYNKYVLYNICTLGNNMTNTLNENIQKGLKSPKLFCVVRVLLV